MDRIRSASTGAERAATMEEWPNGFEAELIPVA
jgi:hypothetical protein